MPLALERKVTSQLEDITLPNHIATNPIYEHTDVRHQSNITSLKETKTLSCNGKEPFIKGTACEDSSHSLRPVEDDDERGEYIQISALDYKYPTMSCSISPRYTETPGSAAKEDTGAD